MHREAKHRDAKFDLGCRAQRKHMEFS